MAATAYQSYEEAARDYLTKFEALREVKPVKTAAVTRGVGNIAVDELITRADEIADVSANMVTLSKGYLESPDPEVPRRDERTPLVPGRRRTAGCS